MLAIAKVRRGNMFPGIFCFILLALLPCSLISQYVPNSSFEIYTTCPTNVYQLSLCPSWTDPNRSSTDYYNRCGVDACDRVDVPCNAYGYQDTPPGGGDAYIGIFIAKYTGTPNIGWSEYATAELLQPLLSGRTYRVSFQVSPADNDPYWYRLTKLGAYFSETPISDMSTFGPIFPTPTTEYQPQVVSNQLLYDETTWTTVQQSFTVTGADKHYITIGNFQRSIPYSEIYPYLPPTYTNGIPFYYYIDKVEIEEITPQQCCGSDVFKVQTVKTSTSEEECCYDITVSANDLACDVYKIGITQNGSTDYFPVSPPLAAGQNKTFEWCVDAFEGTRNVNIAYYDQNDNAICSYQALVLNDCHCNCVPQQQRDPASVRLQRVESNDPERCCWDVFLGNSNKCSIYRHLSCWLDTWWTDQNGQFHDEFTNLSATAVNGWTVESDHSNAGTGYIELQAPVGTGISLPGQSEIKIGTFCLDAPNGPVPLKLHVGEARWSNGASWCVDKVVTLSCAEQENCCEGFSASLEFLNASMGMCCWWLNITHESGSNCLAYGVQVVDPVTSEILLNHPPNGTPLDFSFGNERFGVLCSGASGLSVEVRLLKEDGSVLCTEPLQRSCTSHGGSKIGASEDNTIGSTSSTPSEEQFDIQVLDNRTASVSFISNSARQSKLYVMDLLGRTLLVQSVDIAKGQNQINLDISTLSQGLYRIVIESDQKIYQGLMPLVK